jgi:hypothetical protein
MVERVGLLLATRRETLQRINNDPTKKMGEASGGRKAGALLGNSPARHQGQFVRRDMLLLSVS